MEDQALKQQVRKSLEEGYKPAEITRALEQDGYSRDRINRIFKEVQQQMEQDIHQKQKQQMNQQGMENVQASENRNQAQIKSRNDQRSFSPEKNIGNHENVIPGVDLTDDSYILKQSLIRNKYRVLDQDENTVLRAKQKLFKLKEDLPFKNSDDEIVFRVKAESIVDVAGDYTVLREDNEEALMVLERKYTLFTDRWKIRDPETEELLGKIKNQSDGVAYLRVIGDAIPYFPNIFAFIPHKYDILTRQDEKIGEITGRLSIRDIYDIIIEDTQDVPREMIVASAVTVDALEGN